MTHSGRGGDDEAYNSTWLAGTVDDLPVGL